MNTVVKTKFSVKPVVAAVALALASVNAYADPTPNQLPGAGLIRAVNTGTTLSSPNTAWLISGGGVAGSQVYNGTLNPGFFPGSIQLNNAGTVARAVIRWGGNGASLETYNPQGFNIGSNASVYFTSSATVTDAAVLNIDASGNSSQIFGKLISTANILPAIGLGTASGGGAAPKLFLANANGIIIGVGGEIQGPNGIVLVGANLNSDNVAYEFVGNNGAATSFLDVYGSLGGVSKIVNNGYLYGGAVGLNTNTPAAYVLLVGGDIINTNPGNVFANNVVALAGMRGYSSATVSDTVNGVSKTSVQRLFNVDANALLAGPNECATSPACLEVSKSGSTFVNDGSIAAKNGAITIWAAKGIRSGTLGSANQLIGFFADTDLFTNVYEAGGNTELYNVVGRYETASGVFMDNVSVNGATGWDGDVTINAITRASAPSSITTNSGVFIRGVNVHIDSTINHTVNLATNGDLDIISTNSVSITKDVGAGDDVNVTNTGAGGINISGNIASDLEDQGAGGINILNTASGSPTTISGTLTARGSTSGDLDITVNGPLNITGNLFSDWYDINIANNKAGATTFISNSFTWANENVNIDTMGNTDINSWIWAFNDTVHIYNNSLSSATTTTIAGFVWATNWIDIHNNAGTGSNLNIDASLSSLDDIHIFSHGNLRLAEAVADTSIDVDVDGLSMILTGPLTGGTYIDLNAVNAQSKVYTSAIITAPEIDLEVLNFKGVRDNGADYTSTSQKPNAQFVADTLYLTLYGSLNSPLTAASNPLNDWLKNSIWTEPYTPGAQMFASISAVGAGFQAINLGFRGDAAIDSGNTVTPFFLTGYNTPSIIPPFLGANLGSSLIVQTEGNLDIFSGNIPGFSAQFLFPGGVAFKAGGYLAINTNVNNAIAPNQQYPFSGQWYEASTIIDSGYHATNPGSWINYSSYPVTGPGTSYWLSQPSPGLFLFVNSPEAHHYNVYSTAIVGAPICTIPNPAAPWPPAGC